MLAGDPAQGAGFASTESAAAAIAHRRALQELSSAAASAVGYESVAQDLFISVSCSRLHARDLQEVVEIFYILISSKYDTKKQGSSVNDDNDNPYNAYEMSPDGQRQKDGLVALSSSKEVKKQ